MGKMRVFASLFLGAVFLLSLAFPGFASLDSGDFVAPLDFIITHRPPPGHILSPELTDADIQNTEPDLGMPNYFDYSVYHLNVGGGYTGSYANFYPQPLMFETDWWSDVSEYWVQTIVEWEGAYYAEIGLDITHHNFYGLELWHTYAYAGYSEDPNGWGVVFAYYDLGWDLYNPAQATIACYKKNGGIWGWNVNGVEFATHTYPEDWQGYQVAIATEAYNQPEAGTSGQYVMLASNHYIKSGVNTNWYPSVYNSGHERNGVWNGWMVNLYSTDTYRYDWSTRT